MGWLDLAGSLASAAGTAYAANRAGEAQIDAADHQLVEALAKVGKERALLLLVKDAILAIERAGEAVAYQFTRLS